MGKRRKYSSQMKANIVFKSIRNNNVSEVAREYGISPSLVGRWKKELVDKAPQIFDDAPDKQIERLQKKIHKLEQIIGQKEVEINLIKNFVDFYESPNGD